MNEELKKLLISIKGKEKEVSIDREKEIFKGVDSNKNICQDELSWRILKIQSEFVKGHDFLRRYRKAVTIFGSARNGFAPEIYEEATKLAYLLASDGFAIFTGGGPGIMEAANKGAYKAKGESVGININLPKDYKVTERKNEYVTESESFDYFFTRKVILSFASQVYIAFPGGFGTMDELFQMLTLVQTGKTSPTPIILVNKEFWTPLVDWIKTYLYKKNASISKEDLDLFHLFDTADEVYEFIKKSIR